MCFGISALLQVTAWIGRGGLWTQGLGLCEWVIKWLSPKELERRSEAAQRTKGVQARVCSVVAEQDAKGQRVGG